MDVRIFHNLVQDVLDCRFERFHAPSFVEGMEHRHEHRSCLRTGIGTRAKADLPRNHGGPEVPLRVIVVCGNHSIGHPVEEPSLMGGKDILDGSYTEMVGGTSRGSHNFLPKFSSLPVVLLIGDIL